MIALVVLIVLLLVLGGGGFALGNVLWLVLLAALVLWVFGFALAPRGTGRRGWYRW